MFQRHLSRGVKWTAGHTGLEFREGIIVGDIHKVAASMWFRLELCFRFRENLYVMVALTCRSLKRGWTQQSGSRSHLRDKKRESSVCG